MTWDEIKAARRGPHDEINGGHSCGRRGPHVKINDGIPTDIGPHNTKGTKDTMGTSWWSQQ